MLHDMVATHVRGFVLLHESFYSVHRVLPTATSGCEECD